MIKPATQMLMSGLAVLLCTANAPKESSTYLTPQQAVMGAAETSRGISGQFVLTVRASGRARQLFLNSERDYRDPRNLSIAINSSVEKDLERRLGGTVEGALRGKTIVVRGTARKTKIVFLNRGRPTGKYYYQTHLRLADASALTVLPT